MHAALYIGAAMWILLITGLAQLASWVVEQGLFEGSITLPDIRWGLQLAYSLGLLVPLGIILMTLSEQRSSRVYFGWFLAAILPALTFPAKLLDITDAYGAAVVQIVALGLFLILLGVISARRKSGLIRGGLRGPKPGIWIAVLIAGTLAVPWLLWGALGSPLDLALNLLVAALFGTSAALVLQLGVFDRHTAGQPVTGTHVLVDGIGAFFTLMILAAGLGQTGMQWLLPSVVAALGWAAAGLNRVGRQSELDDAPHWPAQALLIGGAAAAPLILIDPDELMLVISSSLGELIPWAIRATSVSVVIALLAGIVLLVLFRRLETLQSGRLGYIAGGLVWLAALAGYLFIGQPGFYGERLFVVLTDQADVSAAAEIEEIDARRAFVYQTLVEHAETSQEGIRQALSRFGIDYTPYYLVNALEVNGGPLVRLWLESRDDVDRVLPSPRLRPLPQELPVAQGSAAAPDGVLWNIRMLSADRVWEEFGVDGSGIVIGQSDSGVQGDHPELADGYLGRESGDDYAWYDPWNGTTRPTDFGGHGTHTLGSVLGNTTGIAPGAEWIGCVNLGRNLGNPALYLDCLQFMLAPFPQDGDPFRDGDPTRAADVLNNSWSCPEIEGCGPLTFQPAVAALRAAGIFVAVSAGNAGFSGCGSVDSPPAIYDEVYSVGAVGPDGSLAVFSSLGPVTVDGSQRVKPDILAPGDQVLSAYPNSTYQTASGTSMAGPHLAGVVALVWSANPDLIGDIDRTEEILNASAQPVQGELPVCATGDTFPKNGIGYGIVNAYEAVRMALETRSGEGP